MKQNTKTTTKKTSKQSTKKTDNCKCQSVHVQENAMIERSILVTSLLVNLFFLIAWVTILANNDYAHTVGRVIYNL